jgi:hypothetical protein
VQCRFLWLRGETGLEWMEKSTNSTNSTDSTDSTDTTNYTYSTNSTDSTNSIGVVDFSFVMVWDLVRDFVTFGSRLIR